MSKSLRLLAVAWIVVTACNDQGPFGLSITVPGTGEIVVGDELALDVVSTGPVASLMWESSDVDVATVVAGVVEALRPGPVTITARALDSAPVSVSLTVVPRPNGYAADEIDYFGAIAFGSEFGGATALLRRWPSAPTIRVNGSPSAGDLTVLDSVLAEINRVVPLGVAVVTDAPTVEMHFVPQEDFTTILPQAPAGNIGLVWLWWSAGQDLVQSVVLIDTGTAESLRAHIIREEVTQMLGLLQDSFLYPESIFYQGFSDVTGYLPIDRAVIELLYRPELTPGMTAEEAARVARRLDRTEAPLVAGAAWRAHRHVLEGYHGTGATAEIVGSGGSGDRR